VQTNARWLSGYRDATGAELGVVTLRYPLVEVVL
jgi:hypothetical protein